MISIRLTLVSSELLTTYQPLSNAHGPSPGGDYQGGTSARQPDELIPDHDHRPRGRSRGDPRAIFKHFPTKDAIWLAAVEWVREQLMFALEAAASAADSPAAALGVCSRRTWRSYWPILAFRG